MLESRSRTLARTAHHNGKGAWGWRSVTKGHLLSCSRERAVEGASWPDQAKHTLSNRQTPIRLALCVIGERFGSSRLETLRRRLFGRFELVEWNSSIHSLNSHPLVLNSLGTSQLIKRTGVKLIQRTVDPGDDRPSTQQGYAPVSNPTTGREPHVFGNDLTL